MSPTRAPLAQASDFTDPVLDSAVLTSARRELLEVLDRIVAYERYYHSVYGHFTKFMNRIGFSIPKTTTEIYEVHVAEASENILVISALSEVKGRTVDVATIDQDYHLNVNFPLPAPRAEFLKVSAMKYLRVLRASNGKGSPAEEQGIFRGYFRYLTKGEAGNQDVVAVGIKPPVLGLQLELKARPTQGPGAEGDDGSLTDNGLADFGEGGPSTGQKAQGNVMTTLEEARLAQTIFRGEMGRYAKNWAELSKIAGFKFEEKDRWASSNVPFGDASPSIKEIDAHELQDAGMEPQRQIGSVNSNGLEIEPISPDSSQ